jgi:hypothetical protein
MIQCTILTLFIPCIWIELNCSFTTPTNAPWVCIITVLHRFYMFRGRLCHPHTALHQDLKLTKIQSITKAINNILQYSCSYVNHAGLTNCD